MQKQKHRAVLRPIPFFLLAVFLPGCGDWEGSVSYVDKDGEFQSRDIGSFSSDQKCITAAYEYISEKSVDNEGRVRCGYKCSRKNGLITCEMASVNSFP